MKRAQRGDNVIGIPPQAVDKFCITVQWRGPNGEQRGGRAFTLYTPNSFEEAVSVIRGACEALANVSPRNGNNSRHHKKEAKR